MLAYYPITVFFAALGVLIFALLYADGGANSLRGYVAPAPSASPSISTSVPTATSPATATPTATPAPTVDTSGRLFPYPGAGGLYGYKNAAGQAVITPQFLRALEFTSGNLAFAAIEDGGTLRYGLITRDGNWAVSPRFSDAHAFSEGFAAVELDEKWGYIDETGAIVIDCKYREAHDFHSGRAAVRSASTFGYLDPDGNMAIKEQFQDAGLFGNDLAFVTDGAKRYVINKIGEKITTLGKEDGTYFVNGFAVMHGGNSYYYFNVSRKRAFKATYEGAKDFSGDMAAVKIGGKWGFIDRGGVEVIAPKYRDAGLYAQDRAPVQNEEGKWGFIDRAGGVLVPIEYDEVNPFVMGAALVRKANVVGVVTTKGVFTELYRTN